MKIVVDIHDEIYNEICQGEDIALRVGSIELKDTWVSNVIRKGTPLPKGHGDLKDAQDIINKINLNYNNHQSIDAYSLKDMITTVPTIIEADKNGDTEESDAEFMCKVMSKTVNKSIADNNFIGGF